MGHRSAVSGAKAKVPPTNRIKHHPNPTVSSNLGPERNSILIKRETKPITMAPLSSVSSVAITSEERPSGLPIKLEHDDNEDNDADFTMARQSGSTLPFEIPSPVCGPSDRNKRQRPLNIGEALDGGPQQSKRSRPGQPEREQAKSRQPKSRQTKPTITTSPGDHFDEALFGKARAKLNPKAEQTLRSLEKRGYFQHEPLLAQVASDLRSGKGPISLSTLATKQDGGVDAYLVGVTNKAMGRTPTLPHSPISSPSLHRNTRTL